MHRNQVIVVNTEDEALGSMDKIEAHIKGILHRAFSVFVFNDRGEMLIQRRAPEKYHGGGLWSNTCCSHPQPGEVLEDAAFAQLQYEMGMQCTLEKLFSFEYRAAVENDLIEHELDHVFLGYTNIDPQPNPKEVQDWQWITVAELSVRINERPEEFTVWFKTILPEIIKYRK